MRKDPFLYSKDQWNSLAIQEKPILKTSAKVLFSMVICKTQIQQLPFLETYSVTDYSCCFKRNIAIPYNKVEGKLQLLLFLFTD